MEYDGQGHVKLPTIVPKPEAVAPLTIEQRVTALEVSCALLRAEIATLRDQLNAANEAPPAVVHYGKPDESKENMPQLDAEKTS